MISEWKLRRVEETHGDFMEYVYEAADEDVRGGLKAKALYLKEVRAGNAGQEPHTVVTFEGGQDPAGEDQQRPLRLPDLFQPPAGESDGELPGERAQKLCL